MSSADDARASPITDAPLEELNRDRLSVFLYLTFTPEELLELLRRLGVTVPGYRLEHLGDVELADLLADELRASRGVRKRVLARLAEALGAPALAAHELTPELAAELSAVAADEAGIGRLLWRVLSDRRPEIRAAAGPALDRLVEAAYGPEGEPSGGEPDAAATPDAARAPEPASPAPAGAARGDAAVREALREAGRQLRRTERARERAVARAEKLREQLHEARASAATALRETGAARKATRAAQLRAEKAEAALAQARGRAGAAEAGRLRRTLEKAEHRVSELEAELARRAAAGAPAATATPATVEPAATPAPADAPAAEGPATWLLPIYTREFYDSLQGWDRRIQRAAFKQAHLLSQDHRHPSLRALPLEGLPNLYRVRVATDVRLLYRRGEGNTVELLSLIDREDLDRYIKQAKERG